MPAASPILSIVLPTHNRRRLLERSLTSALAQTATEIEVIVVDDGSTDDTAEYLRTVNDSRVRTVFRPVSGGASAARNSGTEVARAPWITFLDDDDELLPQFTERTLERIRGAEGEIGFCWCGVQIVDSRSEETRRVDWNLPSGALPADSHLGVGTGYGLTVRLEALNSIGGFDEILEAAVDFDLLLRLGETFQWVVVPECLVVVHEHTGSRLTDAGPKRAEAYLRILETRDALLRRHPEVLFLFRRKTAFLLYQLGHVERGRRLLLANLRERPFGGRTWRTLLSQELRALRGSSRVSSRPGNP